MGFAASELLHRQFVVSFVPLSLIVAESSRLVQFQVSGQMFGLFLGSLSEFLTIELQAVPKIGPVLTNGFLPNSIGPACTANWLMVCLWTVYLFYLLFGWWKLKELESLKNANDEEGSASGCSQRDDKEDSSNSTASDQETGPARLFHQYSGLDDDRTEDNRALVSDVPNIKFHRKANDGIDNPRKHRLRLGTYAKRVRKLLSFNVAIPITLAMVVYTMFSQEVLFSSCALITNRYFHWRGSTAGFFLCSMTAMILPTDYLCEHIARRYEERTTLKVRRIRIETLTIACRIVNFLYFSPHLGCHLRED
jgi:hypothetical protein